AGRVKTFSVSTLVLLLSCLAFGQGGVSTGDLHVTVRDPKGSLVPNATVTVSDVEKGVVRTATGDGQGGYTVQQLPPDTYIVTVEAPGFGKVQATDVNITVGGTEELPVALAVASGKEVVEVSSQADLVETSRTSTTDTIGQRRIDNLPINGRNYINFTLTDSQVVRDNAPSLGAAPTSGLNISGQRGRANLVNVDGADATDNATNGVRSTVSQEAVQEFQIITNNYAPEYGRASGGVVNIITRSGSNQFHGDVFGYLRNRNFQAVNPFSTVSNPAYTRVQAGVAFGGPIKKDKTYYYFSYEVTRRHETGFSSIAPASDIGYYGLQNFDTSTIAGGLVPLPFGTIQVTPQQAQFLAGLSPAEVGAIGLSNIENYVVLAGASSGQALNATWPTGLVQGSTGGLLSSFSGFPTSCTPLACAAPSSFGPSNVPASYTSLGSQSGNFPVFEGTSLYSLRLDHNINSNNRLTLRVNVSPSTVTGLEGSGEDQPFGQNAYSRTSEQTYRDVAAVVQDTWTLGSNKVNELRFQFARRGLSYFYNTAIPAGADPAVNIPGFAYIGREPYSYIQRVEKRYQVTDNFSWTIGRHNTKFGFDFNYIPTSATFTVNYGGNYDFGSVAPFPSPFPTLNAVQAYGAGLPGDFVQGFGSPSDSFPNIPIGAFWQDSWRVSPKLTLNYGVRYDVEIPPTFKSVTPLAQAGYNYLGLQKGIQTDTNNIQPRVGLAWDPQGDGKIVVRASYGIFYDHPLLGLYFLGDASDGSSSGQLAFPGTGTCAGPGNPANLNAIPVFQGLINTPGCSPGPSALTPALGYLPNQQQFTSLNFPQSLFLNQNYLTDGFPLFFQPFGYPQSKNFVFSYSQQANFTIERDLGRGFALSLAYNFNGGRHLNRPINANAQRGDLLVANFNNALSDPTSYASVGGPLGVGSGPSSQGFAPCGVNPSGQPWVSAALTSFFRPSGLNPSIANALIGAGAGACVTTLFPAVLGYLASTGYNVGDINTTCNPGTLSGCIPFGDMDANYSNGSSVYHGLSANLRKRFGNHYEFLGSYTWSHAIDDSTDLQSTLTPQDSYYPALDRSNSDFDQRHRFVFSEVYMSGKLGGSGFAGKFFSDWTVAPLIEFDSGRPFNIITGNGDNLQESALTGRPNTFVNPACTGLGFPSVNSKFSPTGVLQEPCIADFNGTLLSLDGNLGRNAGLTPGNVFDDLRVAKRIYFGERFNLELIADMFNIANRYNVSAVSPLFTNAGQATAAYDPRQFQFAMKLYW
ncbi:MAG: carboxypeptidase regulatory-like domain-containing protein, partial [Candidatus Sulfotelmatobacter sp.]